MSTWGISYKVSSGNIEPYSPDLRDTLKRAFGNFPLDLDHNNVQVLMGMAVTISDDKPNPYQQIVDLIHEHGNVTLDLH